MGRLGVSRHLFYAWDFIDFGTPVLFFSGTPGIWIHVAARILVSFGLLDKKLIMPDKKTILELMMRPDWNSDLQDCRDLEKMLVQMLRCSDDSDEILEICEVLGVKGSLFVIPVLMAKLSLEQDAIRRSYYLATLAILMSRMQDFNLGPEQDFFSPEWWKVKWVGSLERFISFIAALNVAGDDGEADGEKMEKLAELFIAELEVDLSPYQSFRELKLLSADWDLEADLKRISDLAEQELLIEQLHDESLVSKNIESQVSENVHHMRADYLVTKLGLHDNFELNHYLLGLALQLNYR